jgi:FixJ family two-component response regulator
MTPRGLAMKILVVDDEPRLAQSLARLLVSHGYEPTTASDGLEAWELFEREPESWGMLVTDIRMPKLDGVELAYRVRARGSSVPIVFISGHGDLPDLVELSPACFVAKPFKHQALIDAMRSSLSSPIST